MSIVFRRRMIRVNADADAIIKSLKETACRFALDSLTDSFSKSSFHYAMRIARAADGSFFASAHISGTVEVKDGFCIVRYCVRPAFSFFIAPVFVAILCLCNYIRLFPEGKIWAYFVANAFIWLIFFLEVPWRETTCEERIMQKLKEVDKYHDVSFS